MSRDEILPIFFICVAIVIVSFMFYKAGENNGFVEGYKYGRVNGINKTQKFNDDWWGASLDRVLKKPNHQNADSIRAEYELWIIEEDLPRGYYYDKDSLLKIVGREEGR